MEHRGDVRWIQRSGPLSAVGGVLLRSTIFCFLAVQPASAFFEGVDLDRDYDIVYEASDAGARTITGVRLVGVVKFGSAEFLIISHQPASRVDAVKGYLSIESVRSILPEDTFE